MYSRMSFLLFPSEALLVWKVERGLDQPQVYPFPKQTQLDSGYLLPLLTQSVSCVQADPEQGQALHRHS